MSADRKRLVVFPGAIPAGGPQAEAFGAAFDVIEVDSAETAAELVRAGGDVIALLPAAAMPPDPSLAEPARRSGLEHIGAPAGIVDADGHLTWANLALLESDDDTRDQLVATCLEAITAFNEPDPTGPSARSHRYTFSVGSEAWEALATTSEQPGSVQHVFALMWEITAARRLQRKLDAIDAAGSELLHIDPASLAQLNMAERLKLLEGKIINSVHDLLSFDNFEIRLIDRETNQLELVIAVGLSPLKIGEVIYAEKEGNGISGFAAASGRSYICRDAARDPLYREGLDNAASSLTVPLRLHDRVIGVFNIESQDPDEFDENDRRFAEIFGRYIAMAMHILDLLVVERYTTNEQVAGNVLGELREPIELIARLAHRLRARSRSDEVRRGLDEIVDASSSMQRRLQACMAGPKSILGAEQAMRRPDKDPRMVGKRVIVADNEPTIREAIRNLLSQKGCLVTVCTGGGETIEELRAAQAEHRRIDLVISDVRMPDRNGYEVFRTAQELCDETPVILMTGFGYDPHHSIVRASQEGLHSFLFKPIQASQLLEVIAKAFTTA